MERLTEKRGARSWFLYHLGWYINLLIALATFSAALYYLIGLFTTTPSDVQEIVLMMSFFVLTAILLMGAGISRYQARTEGQHLELKQTIVRLETEIAELRAGYATQKEAIPS
jgi:hypothetical protein